MAKMPKGFVPFKKGEAPGKGAKKADPKAPAKGAKGKPPADKMPFMKKGGMAKRGC